MSFLCRDIEKKQLLTEAVELEPVPGTDGVTVCSCAGSESQLPPQLKMGSVRHALDLSGPSLAPRSKPTPS